MTNEPISVTSPVMDFIDAKQKIFEGISIQWTTNAAATSTNHTWYPYYTAPQINPVNWPNPVTYNTYYYSIGNKEELKRMIKEAIAEVLFELVKGETNKDVEDSSVMETR